jgi:hypothetical protein
MKEKVTLLTDQLLDLPMKISTLQVNMLSLSNLIQEKSDQINIRENEIKIEINSLTDDNGKKVYSNEESRKLAFLTDSKNDFNLTHSYLELKELNYELSKIKIELEALLNTQKNIRSILSIVNILYED